MSTFSSVLMVCSVRKLRTFMFSWKRAKMSPVRRRLKNTSGSDSVWRKNCEIIAKSRLRRMKFASRPRISVVRRVNRWVMINPTMSTLSRCALWCTTTLSTTFCTMIGGTTPSTSITRVASRTCPTTLRNGARYPMKRTHGDFDWARAPDSGRRSA